MGHPNELSPLQGADAAIDSYDDELPPPPPYTDVEGRTIVPATAKFPPMLNGYCKLTMFRTFHLGPHAEQQLFAVETHSGGLSGKKPQIILRDGPDNKHPVLATSASGSRMGSHYVIKIPALDGQGDETEVKMSGVTIKHYTHKFSVPTGEKVGSLESEEFEWRSSSGAEIKDLGKRKSWGWKLVRLGGPNMKLGGSSTAHRDIGFTSDGREVVAVLALNNSASLTKAFRFAFTGSGLTGTLGATWEITAVTSAMQIWLIYVLTKT